MVHLKEIVLSLHACSRNMGEEMYGNVKEEPVLLRDRTNNALQIGKAPRTISPVFYKVYINSL